MKFILFNDDGSCLSSKQVYEFFESHYGDINYFLWSRKTIKMIRYLGHLRISIRHIIKIEYLCIYQGFEITYHKRHYNRIGIVYVSKWSV